MGAYSLGVGFRAWRASRHAAAVSTMWKRPPYTVWGGGSACHAKAFVVNAVQQFHWCWFLSPHPFTGHHPNHCVLGFRAVALNSHYQDCVGLSSKEVLPREVRGRAGEVRGPPNGRASRSLGVSGLGVWFESLKQSSWLLSKLIERSHACSDPG